MKNIIIFAFIVCSIISSSAKEEISILEKAHSLQSLNRFILFNLDYNLSNQRTVIKTSMIEEVIENLPYLAQKKVKYMDALGESYTALEINHLKSNSQRYLPYDFNKVEFLSNTDGVVYHINPLLSYEETLNMTAETDLYISQWEEFIFLKKIVEECKCLNISDVKYIYNLKFDTELLFNNLSLLNIFPLYVFQNNVMLDYEKENGLIFNFHPPTNGLNTESLQKSIFRITLKKNDLGKIDKFIDPGAHR